MKIIIPTIKQLCDKKLNPHNKVDFKTAKRIYETFQTKHAKNTRSKNRSKPTPKREMSDVRRQYRLRGVQRQAK